MSNLSNTVFDFAFALQKNAASDSPFYGAEIKPDVYCNVEKGKTIRVDDVISSDPRPVMNGMREFNALLDVQMYVTPDSQDWAGRKEAREAVDKMALEFIRLVYDVDGQIGDGVCDCRIVKQNVQRNVAGVKTPVVFLRLIINETN